ncbi:Protein deglycase DJ-1zDJ-1 [Boothiomyces sp. JEL0866]|nr:Protein deglycase DJ-1zDJ-1 [Boothiomyces sp. JEL0866]
MKVWKKVSAIMVSAVVVVAPGNEEMEAFKVVVAGLNSKEPTKFSRGVVITPDTTLAELDTILKRFESNPNKWIAAICAAPIALQAAQIGYGSNVTSHPSVKDKLSNYSYQEDRVVVSGKLITSRGPGTTFEFALEIISQLDSKQKAQEVSEPMLVSKI